jgi:Ca2+-binding RTX toxin-like protein
MSIYGKNRSFDAFDGKGGNDTINLTSGDDGIFLDDSFSANSSVNGSRFSGIEVINGNGGNDVIDFSSNIYTYGNLQINGNSGNDVLWGNDGDDKINGFAGNDNIDGGRGNDILSGGDGNDVIKGYDGNDIIIGGLGLDRLTGGSGNDSFVFNNLQDSTNSQMDLILDFVKGSDKIDLHNLEVKSISEFTIFNSGGNTIIDHNNSDFAIKVSGAISLDKSDFIFSS